MPRYALEFVAEIKEVEHNNLSDKKSKSVLENSKYLNKPNLLNNNNRTISSASSLSSIDHNHSTNLSTKVIIINNNPTEPHKNTKNSINYTSNEVMGNAQCCFKRYPNLQTHRHVVISRGIQCNNYISQTKKSHSSSDSNEISLKNRSNTTQVDNGGDIQTDELPLNSMINIPKSQFLETNNHYKSNFDINQKGNHENFTEISCGPPALQDTTKNQPKTQNKSRKYYEDDIDSLSATISNYSLHEKLIKFEQTNASSNSTKDDNQKITFNETSNLPTPKKRQLYSKTSTDALRGSITKSSISKFNRTEVNDISNSLGSYSSSPNNNPKDTIDNNILINSNNYNENNNQQSKLNLIQKYPEFSTIDNTKCINNSVTFMRGSEEFKQYSTQPDINLDNINVLRRKQKYIMKHSRSNSHQSTPDTNLMSQPISLTNNVSQACISNTNLELKREMTQYDTNASNSILPPPLKNTLNTSNDISINPRNQLTPQTSINQRQPRSRERSLTQNSTPTTKVRRSVSFDRRNDEYNDTKFIRNSSQTNIQPNSLVNSKASINDSNNPNSHLSGRNSVRVKYCTNKSVKHKFYIPESANIEIILRDPSDRRIKAICDRHNCDIEIYSKIPKCGFLKNIIILSAPNIENLRKCVRSLDGSMHWCLTAQLNKILN